MGAQSTHRDPVIANAAERLQAVEPTFRFHTFGDEACTSAGFRSGTRVSYIGSSARQLLVCLANKFEAKTGALLDFIQQFASILRTFSCRVIAQVGFEFHRGLLISA